MHPSRSINNAQASLGGCEGEAFSDVLVSTYHAPIGDWSSAGGCDLVPTDECNATNAWCNYWSFAVDGSANVGIEPHEGLSFGSRRRTSATARAPLLLVKYSHRQVLADALQSTSFFRSAVGDGAP